MKGWFNMEEFKNGAISEEALDEIAGGLNMSSSTIKKAVIAAGIGVLAAGGLGAGYTYLNSKGGKAAAPAAAPSAPAAAPASSGTKSQSAPAKLGLPRFGGISKGVSKDQLDNFDSLDFKEKIRLMDEANK